MKDSTITFNILKNNKSTCTFTAVLLDNNIIIKSVYDITDNAPYLIKEGNKLQFSNFDMCSIVYEFIKDRSISNNREDLDVYLQDKYGLRPDINNYRLFNCQYTLTLLHGGVSPFDEYYILPEKAELISFVNINPKFWNVWLLQSNKSYRKLLQNNEIYNEGVPCDKPFTWNIEDNIRVINFFDNTSKIIKPINNWASWNSLINFTNIYTKVNHCNY